MFCHIFMYAFKCLNFLHENIFFSLLLPWTPTLPSLTMSLDFIHQSVVELMAVFEGDEAVETFAFHLVRPTDDSSLSHSWVFRQGRLHLRSAHQVA